MDEKQINEMIHINQEENPLKCGNCYRMIKIGDEYALLEDGTNRCMGCFDHLYPKCVFCGKRVPEDEMGWWGDCRCCPECYEDFNPSFNQEENEAKTNEAYQDMLSRYIGRKSRTVRDDTVELEIECTDCGLVIYRMKVYIDEEGIIYEISRLTAELLQSESERSSSWEDYIIRNEDYSDKVDKMMRRLNLEV